MKEVIYLSVDRNGVKRMTKSLPQLKRGEIPVKLLINVEETAFREPVITREVVIEDWRDGVDIADVDFKERTITEEEAAQIRQWRIEKMSKILEAQGFMVTRPSEEKSDGESDS